MRDPARPRIALFLPSLDGGGAERSFVELANCFASMGARVDLVLASATGPYVAEISPHVRTIDLGCDRILKSIPGLVAYLHRERPDAIVSGLDMANVAAMIACTLTGHRSRAVLTQRATLRDCWRLGRPRTHRAWLAMLKVGYSLARLIISNSHAASDDLHEGFGIPRNRLAVIHNSVDLARIEKLAAEDPGHPWAAPSAQPLILSVGSLTPRKDFPTLLRAFAIVRKSRNCNLVVLGEGTERPMLERLAREIGIANAVQFPGFDSNPFRWMARARVLASSTLAEGCPNVIQQALACGTSVVATDCPGGTSEILEGGRWGRLVPVRDPQAMALALIEALDDTAPPEVRRRAADFEPISNAEQYLQLVVPEFAERLARRKCGGTSPQS